MNIDRNLRILFRNASYCIFLLNCGCTTRDSEFADAIESCDVEKLESHFLGLASTDNRDSPRLNQIFEVARSKCSSATKTRVFRAIPDLGNRLRDYDRFGNTLLHATVEVGNKELLSQLLELGGDIDAVNLKSGESLLLLAIRLNDLQMVDFLLSRGANASLADNLGFAPIHVASLTSPSMLARVLKVVPGESNRIDAIGVPPVFFVMLADVKLNEKIEMIKDLVHHGANVQSPIVLVKDIPDSQVLGTRKVSLPINGETGYEFGARVLGMEAEELQKRVSSN